MTVTANKNLTIALLIDADNVSSSYAETIFTELSKNYGRCVIRRIYGNWSTNTGGWSKVFSEYGLIPVHQHSYVAGKNSTDIALVIDAMDILHSGHQIDAFCIVSSDSDFTRLVQRIRESNKIVIGMGNKKAPKALTKVCDRFVFLDQISETGEENPSPATDNAEIVDDAETDRKSLLAQESETSEDEVDSITPLSRVIDDLRSLLSEKETVLVGEIGTFLHNKYSDFDVRNYGFSKLSVMLDSPELKKYFLLDQSSGAMKLSLLKRLGTDAIEREVRLVVKELGSDGKCLINRVHEELLRRLGASYLKELGYSKPSKLFKNLKGLKFEGHFLQIL